jgi:hypothetical protein
MATARYTIEPSVRLQSSVQAYELQPDDPVSRPLRVYSVSPELCRFDGAVATLEVPYEPLEPGPVGKLFEVESADGNIKLTPVDLDSPRVLIQSGLAPSTSNPGFHQQMTYAVASSIYASFRNALGRLVAWRNDASGRLLLRPHVASQGANAAYDSGSTSSTLGRPEIRFGYTKDKIIDGGKVFACLCNDVIAHEMTHAMIDGLRSHFVIPTNPDVFGLHEGLADIVALFHRFSFKELLTSQIRQLGADIQTSGLLTQVASQLAAASTSPTKPRSAADPVQYKHGMESHEAGNVLAGAVFDAFVRLLKRKTERYFRLANLSPHQRLPHDLIEILADQASDMAKQLLSICIRAIDYCPPVDVEFGEYLRAMITADRNLVREDPWGYRETLISTFAGRGIFARDVVAMSEDALVWRAPSRPLRRIERLSFGLQKFNGDPSVPASAAELEEQAEALGDFITQPQHRDEFGLMAPGADVDPPAIHSIRSSRRVGPDGQVLFDLVAEVTQRRMAKTSKSDLRTKFFGGSTIVIGSKGEVRYVISKNIKNNERLERQIQYQQSSGMWKQSSEDKRFHLAGEALTMMHMHRETQSAKQRGSLSEIEAS